MSSQVAVPSGTAASPLGLHRVIDPPGVLPQAATRLDTRAELWPDEVRVRLERVNLDAASFHQLRDAHGGDPRRLRRAVLDIVRNRGKMHNPVTGSGGMLIGTVDEVGPESPLGLRAGDRVATLVSLTLTPLVIEDDLVDWDGSSEQVPCRGYAIFSDVRSRRNFRKISRYRLRWRFWTSAGPQHSLPGSSAGTRRRRSACSGRQESPVRCRWRQPAGRERRGRSVWCRTDEKSRCWLAPAWPTWLYEQTLATRWRSRMPSRRQADLPTSPLSASTCRGAKAVRLSRRLRTARSSSSPWRRRSARRRWEPKVSPQTSPC